MTVSEFKKLTKAAGLTSQREVAEFLDISLRTAHGYFNDVAIPTTIALLLRAMHKTGLSADDVRAL